MKLLIIKKTLEDYINYFEHAGENLSACAKRCPDGSYTYDRKLVEFEEEMNFCGLIDYDYLFNLAATDSFPTDTVKTVIARSDETFASAVLTYYIRQERFCPGMWLYAVREGIFLSCVKKLYDKSIAA